jgi:glycine/D-amino acid oxidase-like deaminating enzyme
MDLRSTNPYWLLRKGIGFSYPSLQKDLHADVVIIGSGISGSLIAWYLHRAGVQVAVIDRRHVGMGSTVASTALLQYEIDVPMHKLATLVGEKNAVTSYELCRKAIYDLQHLCSGFKDACGFTPTPSFQYASFKKHVAALEKEYRLRRLHGFDVEWLQEKDIRELYGFAAPGGILSADGATVDAYTLTHALLHHLHRQGVAIYDHTPVTDIAYNRSSVVLQVTNGHRITCKKLVMACGYESQNYIPFKVSTLHSTYAIVSEPIIDQAPWYKQSMIWETADPYTYMRSTADNRILVGGKDDPWYNPKKRDASLARKTKALEKQFASLFPHIPFYTDFQWAGTFAVTKDGLPFIGAIPQRPHTWFALGYGGNGITFSIVAAAILSELVCGRQHPHARVFGFNR